MSEVKVDPVIVTIEHQEISCDRCVAPGTCCKAFPLSHEFALGTTLEQVAEYIRTAKVPGHPMPFLPLRRLEVYKVRDTESWLFTCPKLGEDGRCTIYEERPWTCQVYEPGCDQMCIHMRVDGKPIVPQLPIL